MSSACTRGSPNTSGAAACSPIRSFSSSGPWRTCAVPGNSFATRSSPPCGTRRGTTSASRRRSWGRSSTAAATGIEPAVPLCFSPFPPPPFGGHLAGPAAHGREPQRGGRPGGVLAEAHLPRHGPLGRGHRRRPRHHRLLAGPLHLAVPRLGPGPTVRRSSLALLSKV